MASQVRYSKAWAEWFSDVMIDKDLDVKGVVDRYKKNCPAYRTVLRWQQAKNEFDILITAAREYQVMGWVQELDDITKTISPDLSGDAYKTYQADKKNRMEALKFKIAKVAPMITEKYKSNTKQTIEHKGSSQPNIIVHSYARKDERYRDDE